MSAYSVFVHNLPILRNHILNIQIHIHFNKTRPIKQKTLDAGMNDNIFRAIRVESRSYQLLP